MQIFLAQNYKDSDDANTTRRNMRSKKKSLYSDADAIPGTIWRHRISHNARKVVGLCGVYCPKKQKFVEGVAYASVADDEPRVLVRTLSDFVTQFCPETSIDVDAPFNEEDGE